jgi:predicted nucleic acid-binding protein
LLLGAEYEIESDRVLALARDSTCSSYDCEFVALAMKLNSKLVTMDRALLRSFPNFTQPLPTG